MPKKYALQINEESIELVTFLNNGIRPEIKNGPEDREVLIAEINSPREITTNIEKEDSLYLPGHPLMGYLTWIVA